MLLVIQTYTWIFIILATFIPFALYHAKEMTKKIWDARIDEFALELQDGKKMLLFTERMKNEPFKLLGEYKGALVFLVFLSVIDILFWGITIFVLLISAINIWFVQSYNGALLLDFSLTMKLIGGVFQMVAWAFCNAGVWFASFFWHVEQVPSSEDLKPLYTAFFALTIIPTIFALIPWDDKIAPYSEQLKDPEAITIAKSKNRRVRNIFRVSVLVIVYLILQIGNYFSTTHVKMWENEGISRVGKAINHYGEQALAYEAPKMVADSTGVAPVTYSTPKGGTPSTTGVVSVGADGKPLLYEFVVEKWKYGTHVFVHLRDLHKRHGYSIPLLLAAMA